MKQAARQTARVLLWRGELHVWFIAHRLTKLAHRQLDGALSDHLLEEAVVLLKRTPWFLDHLRVRAPAPRMRAHARGEPPTRQSTCFICPVPCALCPVPCALSISVACSGAREGPAATLTQSRTFPPHSCPLPCASCALPVQELEKGPRLGADGAVRRFPTQEEEDAAVAAALAAAEGGGVVVVGGAPGGAAGGAYGGGAYGRYGHGGDLEEEEDVDYDYDEDEEFYLRGAFPFGA